MQKINHLFTRTQDYVQDRQYRLLWMGIGLAALCTLLFWKLGGLTNGYTAVEYRAWSDLSLQALANPFTFLHTLPAYVANMVHASPTSVRAASALLAAVVAGSFYILVRSWHGKRVAVFASVLLVTSAWFLHVGRYGDAQVLQWATVPLLLALVMMRVSRRSLWSWPIYLLIVAASILIPGMIWFVLLASVMQAKQLMAAARRTPLWLQLGCIVTVVLASVWVGLEMMHGLHNLLVWAGLPSGELPSAAQLVDNTRHTATMLFWHAPLPASLWLGRLPLLDALAATMFALGVYHYVRVRSYPLRYTAGLMFLMAIVLSIVGGLVNAHLLLPFIYLIIAGGIAELLGRWYVVFPRNPIAQAFALVCVAVVITISIGYNFRHYYVAWPASVDTHNVYTKLVDGTQ